EQRLELFRSELVAADALPLLEHAFGCAIRHPAVDHGASTDAAAFDVRDWRCSENDGRGGVAIEPRNRLGRVRIEARSRDVASLFDEQDVVAGFGELGAGHRATGAGADYDDICRKAPLRRVVGEIEDHANLSDKRR